MMHVVKRVHALSNNESSILVYRVIAMMCVNCLGYGVHVCVRFRLALM